MHAVRILYTNYKGETSWRNIYPGHIWWAKTPHHPQGGYLLTAFDLDKKADRDFALKDIQKWEESPQEEQP